MIQDTSPNTPQEWKLYFEKKTREETNKLYEGKYQEQSLEVEDSCQDIDDDLHFEYYQQWVEHPDGKKELKTFPRERNPNAMAKVSAELDKQEIRRPLNQKIKLEVTKTLLPEKESQYNSFTASEEKEAFAKAVNLEEDRAFVANDNLVQEQEGVERAEIKHFGHVWQYEKTNDYEHFTAKNENGTPLVTIEKLDLNREFSDKDNAVVMDHDLQSKIKSAHLETILERVEPELDTLKKRDIQTRMAVQDKAKNDFNQAVGNEPPPQGNEDPPISPHDPDPTPKDGNGNAKKFDAGAKEEIADEYEEPDLGDDSDWLKARLDEPYTRDDYIAEYGDSVERSVDKNIDKSDKGIDMD